MPHKTRNTYLFCKTKIGATEFTKLCEISTYPDITDLEDMQFKCAYDVHEYQRIKSLEGRQLDYELRFGNSGVFSWTGDIFITPKGGKINNDVRDAQITCYPSSEIIFNG